VELAPLVAARVNAWAPLAEERGVVLLTDVPDGARARSTPVRLEQVLDNLLENALAVTPAGRTVELSARRSDGAVELHVVDEGPGLSPADRERAFDRFWRGRGGRDGTGLGLAIVRRLVEADGGSVELREAPTGGVDAVVTLAV
jgi:signal transduction histidine kinase